MATTTSKAPDEIKQDLLLKFRTIITLLTLVKAPRHQEDGPSTLTLSSDLKLPALNQFERALQRALKAFVDASTRNSEVLAAAGNIDPQRQNPQVTKFQTKADASPPVGVPKEPPTTDVGSARREEKPLIALDQEISYADVTVYQGAVTYGIAYSPNPDHCHVQ
jgi:hypothetical protein